MFTGEFVSLKCADGVELDALWVPAKRSTTSVIHLHGKGGNFCHNRFLSFMYATYPLHRVSILSVNTRGSGALVEGFRNGDVVYLGSATETIADSVLDIDASIAFLASVADDDRIVLQGHSHGCEKAVYWCDVKGVNLPLVLLSPADSASLHRAHLGHESIESQIERLSGAVAPGPWGLAPETEYGINTQGASYLIPISTASLCELLRGPGLYIFDQHAPREARANRAFIALGRDDALQVPSVDDTAKYFARVFPMASVHVLADADHHFRGHEHALVEAILGWLGVEGLARSAMPE